MQSEELSTKKPGSTANSVLSGLALDTIILVLYGNGLHVGNVELEADDKDFYLASSDVYYGMSMVP